MLSVGTLSGRSHGRLYLFIQYVARSYMCEQRTANSENHKWRHHIIFIQMEICSCSLRMELGHPFNNFFFCLFLALARSSITIITTLCIVAREHYCNNYEHVQNIKTVVRRLLNHKCVLCYIHNNKKREFFRLSEFRLVSLRTLHSG